MKHIMHLVSFSVYDCTQVAREKSFMGGYLRRDTCRFLL